MKLGILGTGMIVQDLLTTIDRLKIDSLAILATERSRGRAEEMAARYGIQRIFFDYDEMLADASIDTIYVALPNFLHYQFAKKALLADKNVIVEKPGVLNFEEFVDLRETATGRDKILVEAVTTHYLPAFRSVKANLGRLGDVKIVTVNYSQYSSRYDKFKIGEILPAFDPAKGGGALMDLNVYNLNFVVGLFGAPKNFTYTANISRGVDTSGVMVLDYGGFKAVCIGAKDCQAPTVSAIQGDGGHIVIDTPVNRFDSYTISDNDGNSTAQNFADGRHRMVPEFEIFIDMIDGHDVETAAEMLEISGIVAKILQGGREQVGIGK